MHRAYSDPDHKVVPIKSELNEAQRAALLEQKLPPISVWEKLWYVYKDGFWQKTDRDIYRADALALMPEDGRTARKASQTLDHFESLRQLPADCFYGANRFDGQNILLNISNGVLRITPDCKVTLEKHSREHFFCAKLAANYDANATAPLFESTLAHALPDPADQLSFVTWAASILLPSNRLEKAMCCYGPSGTGKSTLAIGIQSALSGQVTRLLTMREICNEQGYHVPNLRHAMLNVSTELDTVVLENSENFKRLISGEEIEARPIYRSPFVMAVTCKFLFLANNLPRFKYGTDAELRRLLFLRFNHVPETVDTTIKQRIAAERDGILTILVDHLRTLLRDNTIPHGGEDSTQTRERFSATNDPIGTFVNSECILNPTDFIAKETLENRFKQYLDQIGAPLSLGDNFFKLLYDRYPAVRSKKIRTNEGRCPSVSGIGLKPDA